MGFYINPSNMSKEDFLVIYGTPWVMPTEDFNFNSDVLPVCWMHNGAFTAAGIAYSKKELHAFQNPSDTRNKRWFIVKKKHLGQAAGLCDGWIEEIQKESL
jgi:hypothetical protein